MIWKSLYCGLHSASCSGVSTGGSHPPIPTDKCPLASSYVGFVTQYNLFPGYGLKDQQSRHRQMKVPTMEQATGHRTDTVIVPTCQGLALQI